MACLNLLSQTVPGVTEKRQKEWSSALRTWHCTNGGQENYCLIQFVPYFWWVCCERSCFAPQSECFLTWRQFLQVCCNLCSLMGKAHMQIWLWKRFAVIVKSSLWTPLSHVEAVDVYLHFGSRRMTVVSFTLRPLYPPPPKTLWPQSVFMFYVLLRIYCKCMSKQW